MVCLDTSAAVALFVPEPKTPAIAAWFAANAESQRIRRVVFENP
jgi:predicted nucleic acid-binding protein